MSRRIAVVVILFLLFVAGGFLITFIQKARFAAHLLESQNNLRQLAMFAAHHANPSAGPQTVEFPKEIPPATVVLAGVVPENRLSWAVPVLPGVDRTKNPVAELLAQIDTTRPWTAERNQRAAQIRLNLMLCPENTPQTPPDAPAITCYVGISGIGLDAANIAIPQLGPTPSRAGAFRYDAPTPFERITDGLSQTLLIGETADEPGPWLRGGPSTTRGLDDAPNAKPLIKMGGQFGGYFPNGANFAMCDGSVRLFTPEVTPSVLLNMATISGGENEVIPE